MHDRAAELVERARKKQESHFEFYRLAGAADALLEASERIFDSRKHRSHSRESQRDAAMALQRHYFRSQQAEYFAELSQEPEADAYLEASNNNKTHAASLLKINRRLLYDKMREHGLE